MLNRRDFSKLALATGTGAVAASSWSGPAWDAVTPPPAILNDDGLYEQEWFLQSFLDLREDLEATDAEGKRFAIFWELQGCPYCKETHFVNFANPEIHDYVKDNFVILQLNMTGGREVTDFDGTAAPERKIRKKWGVRFSPSIMFFPEGKDLKTKGDAKALEIARMPGYFRPPHFMAMFKFVRENAYKSMNFRQYLRAARS
jgi:thioredoxin-related protein